VDLKPVSADNYEAGLRGSAGPRVDFEATVYQLDISDDILSFFDPGSGLRTSSNAGATRHRGVELALAVRPINPLRLDGSWAFTRQTYREWQPSPTVDYSGKEIEVAPRQMGRVGATFTPAFLGDGFVSAEWVHLGSYWLDPANTERYDGYDVFHLSAAVPVVAGLQLVGRLQNLTDKHYGETGSFNAFNGRRFVPGAPRTLYVGAQYRMGSERKDR
jgi:outer membrane receptor protein involved in Fe transport